ncbi:MAG TPA: class I SAM-dependent methyltransferase [Thermomicrobiales bacterium]|nr:class I SAM-dependent methyltransferase [Thermomicrobiales bacterium]
MDERGNAVLDPAAAWGAAADAWDAFVESGADYHRTELHGPALLEACGDVRGLRALDLGCGQGWFSRQLAGRGAYVVGVDAAAPMLAHARRHEAERPLGIAYHHLDAAAIDGHWPPGSFDLVTACMVLHDLPNPGEVLSAARRVLTETGRLAFSIVHPVTSVPPAEWVRDDSGRKGPLRVDRYFDSGPFRLRWAMARLTAHWDVTNWHWTLTEWSDLIEGAGFRIERLREPRPTATQAAANPSFEPARRLPYFLVVELSQRPAATTTEVDGRRRGG